MQQAINSIVEKVYQEKEKNVIAYIDKELGASTNPNETILRVIRKGGVIANAILSLLK